MTWYVYAFRAQLNFTFIYFVSMREGSDPSVCARELERHKEHGAGTCGCWPFFVLAQAFHVEPVLMPIIGTGASKEVARELATSVARRLDSKEDTTGVWDNLNII